MDQLPCIFEPMPQHFLSQLKGQGLFEGGFYYLGAEGAELGLIRRIYVL